MIIWPLRRLRNVHRVYLIFNRTIIFPKTCAQSGEQLNFLSKLVCILSDCFDPELFYQHSSLFQIMDETQTQIAWPSKLKIGAKSKKGDCMLKGQMSTSITFSASFHPLVVC